MKKTFFALLSTGLMLAPTALLVAQSNPPPIYGVPDKYQRYLVLDAVSYPDVKQWRVDVFHHEVNPTDSSTSPNLVETIVLEDKSFVKLSNFHLNKNTQTTIGVRGYDLNENLVTDDEWISDAPA